MSENQEPAMDPLKHDGTVVAVEDGVARVRFQRTVRCGSCCGCSAAADGSLQAEVAAIPGVKPGDRVEVALDPKGVWRGTFWTFVLPLVGLVGGALLGHKAVWLHLALGLSADAAAGLCGMVVMALVFFLGILRNRRLEREPSFQPRIVRRL